MKSLDPRVNRLNLPDNWSSELEKEELDQLATYEVFVQPKEGKPYQHEGIVHASNEDMAFVFAKEQFSRRNTCTGLWVCATQNVMVSELTEAGKSVYEDVSDQNTSQSNGNDKFEVFHLLKRGKQHIHMGRVEAANYDEALIHAKAAFSEGKPALNVWIVKSGHIFHSTLEDVVIWHTLPEKKFRDAIAYKAMDKIKKFKEEQAAS
ncbi:MAG: phenylacetic acid degradation b [Bacteroidota bacterium]